MAQLIHTGALQVDKMRLCQGARISSGSRANRLAGVPGPDAHSGADLRRN